MQRSSRDRIDALTDTCPTGRIVAALPHDRASGERSVAGVVDRPPGRGQAV